MRIALIGLVVGFVLGATTLVALRPWIERSRARRLFDRWVMVEGGRSVRRGLDGARGGIKQRLGEELTPRLASFPFEAADARFLGHPAQFVIFDGHTDVRDRKAERLRAITFVTVGSAHEALEAAGLIDECLRAGRVRWSTLRPETVSPTAGQNPSDLDEAARGFQPPMTLR